VAYYRMYCLGATGRLSLAQEIEANSDEEAVSKAREMRPDVLQCEIWQGNRLVTSFHRQNRADRRSPLSQ
jgi:hypothetical protein